MYDLMAEAEDVFETEFDPLPEVEWAVASGQWSDHNAAIVGSADPCLPATQRGALAPAMSCKIDLDNPQSAELPPPIDRSQAITLWLQSKDFDGRRRQAAELVEQLLADNPFTTLQIVLEPTCDADRIVESLTSRCCEAILQAAFCRPTYLDRFYSVQPGRLKGAKRLVIVLPTDQADDSCLFEWREEVSQYATIVAEDNLQPVQSTT